MCMHFLWAQPSQRKSLSISRTAEVISRQTSETRQRKKDIYLFEVLPVEQLNFFAEEFYSMNFDGILALHISRVYL